MINENWLYFNLNGSKSPLSNRKKATCGETVIFLPFGLPFFFTFLTVRFDLQYYFHSQVSFLFLKLSLMHFPWLYILFKLRIPN